MGSAGSSNLPHPMTPLIGRRRELDEIAGLLSDPEVRLLTLVGPGGVGKTRLALCAAEMLARDFVDGVRFVDLSSLTDAALVPASIAQAVGLSPAIDRPIEEALIEHLLAWNLLLVLDNFEHVLDGARLVSRLQMVCPELVVLATSRQKLDVYGERIYRVDSLSLPKSAEASTLDEVAGSDAVRLFSARAKAAHRDFELTEANVADVAVVCRRLDGLPLAIELAAARIAVLSARTMGSRVDPALPLLTGGGRDRPERHKTMRDAIVWSYRQLTPEEQVLLRRVSVLISAFSLEAAETVVGALPANGGPDQGKGNTNGDSPVSVLDALSSLLDKSLLRRVDGPDGEPRLLMQDTIREFGLEQLRSHDEEEATRWAHAGYVLRLIEEAETGFGGSTTAAWFAVIEREHANVRSAIQWSLSHREEGSETALRICIGVWSFWKQSGKLAEARIWLPQAIEVAGVSLPSLVAKAERLLGHSHVLGAPDRARVSYQRSLELCREIGDARGEVAALTSLGMVSRDAGTYEEAEDLFRASLKISESLDYQMGVCMSHHFLGELYTKKGEFSAALIEFGRAMDLCQSHEYRSNMGFALKWISLIDRHQGRHEAARTTLERARDLLVMTGNLEAQAFLEFDFGHLALICGDHENALEHFLRALSMFRKFDVWDDFAARVLESVATLALNGGQWAESAWLLAAAAAWRRTRHFAVSNVDRRHVDDVVAKLRQRMGNEALKTQWLIGESMSFDEAIAIPYSIKIKPRVTSTPESRALPADIQRLSPREREILCLVAEGLRDREIADNLGIADRTVTTVITRILGKLVTHNQNRTSAATYAVAHGLCRLRARG